MRALALTCYTTSLVLELVGIVLIIAETRRAQRALSKYVHLNPADNPGGSWDQIANLQPVLVAALGNQVKRWYAVALLLVGVGAGFAGNVLTLPH